MTTPGYTIDEILMQEAHLIHSFADLFKIRQHEHVNLPAL